MGQVTSILGNPYKLPHYPDKRGSKEIFQAVVFRAGCDDCEVINVAGTGVVFGLVLHRQITQAQTPPGWAVWAISEPTTGCRVVSGRTRQDALDTLAERVAFLGGEDAFRRAIAAGISATRARSNAY